MTETDQAPEDDRDDRDHPTPPGRERVIGRLFTLAALAGRGFIEMQTKGSAQHPDAARQGEISDWMLEHETSGEAELAEVRLVDTKVGSIAPQDALNCVWSIEGLGVIAWALGLFTMPAYDETVNVDDLLDTVGLLNGDRPDVVRAEAQLRSRDELEAYRKQALALHWRLRDFSLNAKAMDFREWGKTAWFGPLSLDWARFGGDGDLLLGGKSVVNASDDTVGACSSIAMERHKAINWLCGDAVVYSEVDTST